MMINFNPKKAMSHNLLEETYIYFVYQQFVGRQVYKVSTEIDPYSWYPMVAKQCCFNALQVVNYINKD